MFINLYIAKNVYIFFLISFISRLSRSYLNEMFV